MNEAATALKFLADIMFDEGKAAETVANYKATISATWGPLSFANGKAFGELDSTQKLIAGMRHLRPTQSSSPAVDMKWMIRALRTRIGRISHLFRGTGS